MAAVQRLPTPARYFRSISVTGTKSRASGLPGGASSGPEQVQQNVPPKAQVKLLDDLVGAGEERWRHVEAQRLGRLEIDDHLVLGWRLNRKIAQPFALEEPRNVTRGLPILVDRVRTVVDQASLGDEIPERVNGGQSMSVGLRDDLLALNDRQGIWQNDQPTVRLTCEFIDIALQSTRIAEVQGTRFYLLRRCQGLNCAEQAGSRRVCRIAQYRHSRNLRRNLFEQLQPFSADVIIENSKSSRIPSRACETIHKAGTYRVRHLHEHNGNG